MKNLRSGVAALFIVFPLLFIPKIANAESFTIFLVRHAEKQKAEKNPSLTFCGESRASQLATTLSEASLTKVYSTSYQRTMQTAAPTAKAQNLPIKQYAPNALEQFAFKLKQGKENALVVGHSNTTPQLVSLLTGESVAPLSEKEYQMLYLVQFQKNSVTLTQLKQPLYCK